MTTHNNYVSPSFGERKRRHHHKSRNGCRECKRRRTKCDELKPSCSRCIRVLHKCIYDPIPVSNSKIHRDGSSVPSSSCTTLAPSPDSPSYSERSLSSGLSPRSSPGFAEQSSSVDPSDIPEWLSDTELYHHYLQHTSRTLAHCQSDKKALQFGLPTLALQDKTVFHSLLAVSTACLGCDMISKRPPPDIQTIKQILITGYRHYNLASEGMRKMISSSGPLKLEPLLASALILVPFATSSQQINHWISEKTGTQKIQRPLSTTPRDAITMLRGVRTTLQALNPSGGFGPPLKEMVAIDSPSVMEVESESSPSRSASTHVMAPIVAATSEGAFCKLQHRLDLALLHNNNGSNAYLSACSAAFEVLKDIKTSAIAASKSSPSLSSYKPAGCVSEPEQTFPPHVASWLRSYASRIVLPLPTEPPTRFFLSFLVRVPQAYLDLVLPLLDQRLETPAKAKTHDKSSRLTTEQALALDIYAHWSVFMFLVEDSWWIGVLPEVTLAGMVNRYGDDFVTDLWSSNSTEHKQWWPGSMLSILREIKKQR